MYAMLRPMKALPAAQQAALGPRRRRGRTWDTGVTGPDEGCLSAESNSVSFALAFCGKEGAGERRGVVQQ